MTFKPRFWCLALALLAHVLVTTASVAQKQTASSNRDEALNRQFQAAVAQYDAGHFPEAAAQLEKLLQEVPDSFEAHVDFNGENVLAVDVDSTERPDIPPFGYEIDYLTFGGIYREVSLRVVPSTFIDNIFVRPKDVLSPSPSVEIDCFVQHLQSSREPLQLEMEIRDGDRVVSKSQLALPSSANTGAEPIKHTLHLDKLTGIKLWSLEQRNLYTAHVRLLKDNQAIDSDSRRFAFREAQFTDHGFELNGKVIKLRGLDRHQTFPWVGQAMPARVQRRDAQILRNNLKCNIVRTSHYPQSRHFLDACDEIGLLVLEEIPGWQHIGDKAWQDISVDNVSRMIRRDWNHPSIILWGVRINESRDNQDFYTRTNALAHQLDPTRQTGGIRYFQESEFLEDVFTMNDFGFPLKPPNHPRYLNTEFVGHTYPTKTIDQVERLTEHTLRHARIHDQLASNPQYAGGIGWCAFDYNTHESGDVLQIYEFDVALGIEHLNCRSAPECGPVAVVDDCLWQVNTVITGKLCPKAQVDVFVNHGTQPQTCLAFRPVRGP